jgi:hypothetical protein
MPQSTVAAKVHQALDVHRYLAPEIAFDGVLGYFGAQRIQLFLTQFLYLGRRRHAGRSANFERAIKPDPVDMGKRDARMFLYRYVDAGYAGHREHLLIILIIVKPLRT